MTPDVAPQDLELGVIGNCEVAALIDAWGRIVWACLPRLDGDPVFCGLLKRDAGSSESGVFAIDLHNFSHAEQNYGRNTAVLETVLYDSEGGALRITDFCPRFRARERFFRPRMFMRLIEPAAGRPRVTLRLRPECDYGAAEPTRHEGSHHVTYDAGSYRFRVTTDASIAALHGGAPTVIDKPIALIIGPDEPVDEAPMSLVRRFLDSTRTYWEEWVRGLSIPVDWQSQVIRAAISLKLCTYEDTGAVVAALTTSIPEHADSGRNWDYRYCWLRDSYFVIRALNRLGATQTMENYLHFIDQVVTTGNGHAADGQGLQPLFGIGGDFVLPEREIGSLPGYRSMGPVRVGNLAYVQKQHDVYGAAILACTQLFIDERLTTRGDWQLFNRLESFGHAATRMADRPDAGPWEFRGSEQIHTYSVAMSWAGCDRLARVARWLRLDERAVVLGAAGADAAVDDPRASMEPASARVHVMFRRHRSRFDRDAAARARAAARDRRALRRHRRTRSSACSRTATGCSAIDTRTTSGGRARRSRSAASGMSTHSPRWDGGRKRATSSSACSLHARDSVCCRRTSIHVPASCGATFRRPTVSSASSIPPCA